MNYKHTFEAILHDIDGIRQSVQEAEFLDRPMLIELDRIMMRMVNVYDLLHMVKTEMQQNTQEFIKEPIASNNYTTDNIEMRKAVHVKVSEPEHIETEKQILKQEDNPIKEVEKKELRLLGEKFDTLGSSLNDKIAGSQKKKDLGSTIQKKPLQNIESAIGINEKFLFINELFGGNTEKYKSTIDILNHYEQLEEAQGYLEKNFSWDYKGYPAMKLMELVNRKFNTPQ